MTHVHLVLQGKGGVGKTFVASTLAQYLARKGPIDCIDTDPVNATFAGFRHLRATRLDLMEDDMIQPRRFDELVDRANTTQAPAMVIDNGASSFVALAQYLVENDVPALLHELGHRLTIHVLITGGQALLDCAENMRVMIQTFAPTTEFVVWINPYFGPVELRGKQWEEMKVYSECKDRIRSVVYLPAWQKDTTGRDVAEMLGERLSFEEALADADRSVMVRQRLKMARARVFEQIDAAAVA
jgi:hypothetical protein